ncbi:unnamed protein product [Vicia faba]|uniref:Uncharacterized protein n=1 Tax=Vicia faba TaxID=3906 RepID=A0AAV1AIG8_VICFA|nr:unnamed protein product [Vicia faba]
MTDGKTTGEENLRPEITFPPEITVGIDIETCSYCVAVWNGTEVEYAVNKNNMKAYDQETLIKAKVFKMRRLIGRAETDPVTQVTRNLPFQMLAIDDESPSSSPEEFLTSYLKDLKQLAESVLERSVRDLVLTHPVSFNRFQLTRIHDTCRKAGLQILQMIPQPTAVAFLYAQQQLKATSSSSDLKGKKTALIFNMDSGYCDVAVIAATLEGKCRMKALAGSAIGGEDVIGNTMRLVIPDFKNKLKKKGRNKKLKSLRVEILKVIHGLKDKRSVEFDLDLGDGRKIRKVVKKGEFEEVNREVILTCERLIRRCLQDSKIKANSLDDVIIVGEFGNMLKLHNLVPKKGVAMNPLEAALCGAAVAGAVASGINDPSNLKLSISPITSHSLGIRANGNKFVCVIPRNTSLPVMEVMKFTTSHENQTEVLILVYEGVLIIEVVMEIDSLNKLRIGAGVFGPVEMPKPMIDPTKFLDYEALNRMFGDKMDLATFVKKK